MLADIVDVLADPTDGSALSSADNFSRLVSETGHSYDVAKQGYVTLFGGAGRHHDGDSADMVAARETFLSTGHFAPFVEGVSETIRHIVEAAGVETPTILEVGAGTGYYLAHTLDDVEGSRGIGLDVSTAAAKALAKAHPHLGAVVADVWEKIPLKDESVDIISVVFAPRNPVEFARVLKPEGRVVMLTPTIGHLDELRGQLGIIGVEKGKIARMAEQSEGLLEIEQEPKPIQFSMVLNRDSIEAQVGMSPSARHIDDLEGRVRSLPDSMEVTANAHLTVWKRV